MNVVTNRPSVATGMEVIITATKSEVVRFLVGKRAKVIDVVHEYDGGNMRSRVFVDCIDSPYGNVEITDWSLDDRAADLSLCFDTIVTWPKSRVESQQETINALTREQYDVRNVLGEINGAMNEAADEQNLCDQYEEVLLAKLNGLIDQYASRLDFRFEGREKEYVFTVQRRRVVHETTEIRLTVPNSRSVDDFYDDAIQEAEYAYDWSEGDCDYDNLEVIDVCED